MENQREKLKKKESGGMGGEKLSKQGIDREVTHTREEKKMIYGKRRKENEVQCQRRENSHGQFQGCVS